MGTIIRFRTSKDNGSHRLDDVHRIDDECISCALPNGETSDFMEMASRLEILQLNRRVFKSARDDLEACDRLTAQHDSMFQRRFDEITQATMELAGEAARMEARNRHELRAKAEIVMEFAEVCEFDVVNRMTLSLVRELIGYLDSHGDGVSK